jgi:hypothetical protein
MKNFREIKTKDGVKLLPITMWEKSRCENNLDCSKLACGDCALEKLKIAKNTCCHITQSEINDYIKEVEIMECPLLKSTMELNCPLKPNETCPLKKTTPLTLLGGRKIEIEEGDLYPLNQIGSFADKRHTEEWGNKSFYIGGQLNFYDIIVGVDSRKYLIAVPLKKDCASKYGVKI